MALTVRSTRKKRSANSHTSEARSRESSRSFERTPSIIPPVTRRRSPTHTRLSSRRRVRHLRIAALISLWKFARARATPCAQIVACKTASLTSKESPRIHPFRVRPQRVCVCVCVCDTRGGTRQAFLLFLPHLHCYTSTFLATRSRKLPHRQHHRTCLTSSLLLLFLARRGINHDRSTGPGEREIATWAIIMYTAPPSCNWLMV